MSYFHYFKLLEPPFSIAPDPRYFFNSERHREALEHLKYGVSESGGFLLLTGEVGTGKTILCRCMLAQLPEDVDIALILNPRLNASELLATICDELRIKYPNKTRSLKRLIDALNEHLLSAHVRGRRTVVIIDEAQNLSLDVLEQIRLLTNLETNRTKLLQIILVGQPELNRLLKRRDLRQLTQRITCRYHLKTLSMQGTKAYIQHRLAVADGNASELFSSAAIHKIHRITGGTPRLINLICDRALHTAYLENKKQVDTDILKKAAHQVGPALTKPWYLQTEYLVPGIALVVLATAFGSYSLGYWGNSESKPIETISLAANESKITTNSAKVETPKINEKSTIDKDKPANPKTVKKVTNKPTSASDQSKFAEIIRDRALNYGAAFTNLLSQWGVGGKPHSKNYCRSVIKYGVRCSHQNDNWFFFRQLNRPAVLEFIIGNGQKRYATIIAANNENLTFKIGKKSVNYSVNQILPYWSGRFTLLWKPPNRHEYILFPGQKANSVRWLRQHLMNPTENANSTFFDSALKKKVISFQIARGLDPDGIVGPNTFMHLNTSMKTPDIPLLKTSVD